jgi:NAD+ synthase
MELLPRPISHTEKIIEQFISSRFEMSKADTCLIGLSGGLDSAVVLKFLVRSVGKERVRAFFLPYGNLSDKDRAHSQEAAGSCGVELSEIDITPVVESIPFKTEGMVKGNLMARARMLVLYTYANLHNGLVVGTSNKTELLLGYFTKYGDGAADIYPIGDLFKTQVRTLASEIEVPESILNRPPSASLVEGQTDEGELGIPYPILDQVLNGHLRRMTTSDIADNIDHSAANVNDMDRAGFEPPVTDEMVERIIDMVRRSRHKRLSLVIPKVQTNTVGVDLRERW